MDVDAATYNGTAVWPSGGAGSVSTTAAGADPQEQYVSIFGCLCLTAAAAGDPVDVEIRAFDGTTTLLTMTHAASFAVGRFFPAIYSDAATFAGIPVSTSVPTISWPSMCVAGFSVFTETVTTDQLKVRVFYRPETRGPA